MTPPETSSVPERRPARSGAARILGWILGLVLIAIGLVALAWAIGRSSDTVTETVGGDIDRVVIDVNGRVALRAADVAEVTVEREWLIAGSPDVAVSREGGTLEVTGRCGFFGWGCQVHVDATAPPGAEVVVETAAGNVTVSGFQSGVDLTTSAGNVTVEGITGPAVLRSSAGRIEGDVTGGNVDAQTSAGRIDLDVMGQFSRLSAVTSAGRVELTVPDDTYRVDADTSAGNIETNVATDPDATREIVARSSAGSIRIDRTAG